MISELGFFGQESDINRACLAFGLDTVNYRAFPNNGPVPATAPQETASALDLPISNAPEATGPKPSDHPTLLQRQTAAFSRARGAQPAFAPAMASAPTAEANLTNHAASLPGPVAFQLLTQALSAPPPHWQTAAFSRARGAQPAFAPAMASVPTAETDPATSPAGAAEHEAFGKAFAAAYIAAFGRPQR